MLKANVEKWEQLFDKPQANQNNIRKAIRKVLREGWIKDFEIGMINVPPYNREEFTIKFSTSADRKKGISIQIGKLLTAK